MLWEQYRAALLERLITGADSRLRAKARRLAKSNSENAYAFSNGIRPAIDGAIQVELERLLLDRADMFSEVDFLAFDSEASARLAINQRHGEELLGQIG